ncbi:GntR family transcriptional regulator, partial [Mycobacterium tuberculosis]|nr:GntR family transcriptional regulator [Mycobacterium tuberculosis]
MTGATPSRHLKVIYKKIATELRTRINSDDYAVGDMLPSEKALAAELKVSV